MNFEIVSHEALGPIHFGMSRDEVQRSVGAAVKLFRKTPVGNLVDAFNEEGIHVYYDAEDKDKCEAIEVASPANPLLLGRGLVGRPFAEVLEWLRTLDADLAVDESGLTSLALGVGVFAPFAAKAPFEPVEAVIAFKRGYYK